MYLIKKQCSRILGAFATKIQKGAELLKEVYHQLSVYDETCEDLRLADRHTKKFADLRFSD